jgi:uncharacterized protein YlxW (UPF0749 family)
MPKGKKPSLQDVLDEVRGNQEQLRGHGVLLEDIRSQNRATIEALQATRDALEEKIDQVDRNSQARDAVLEAAVRQNGKDIRKNSEDIRLLTTRVDALGPLDQRVSALERRPSR